MSIRSFFRRSVRWQQAATGRTRLMLERLEEHYLPGFLTPIGSVSGFVSGDFNNDGRPDLAAPGVSVLLGKGDGSFQAGVYTDAGNGNAVSLATGDFNADGKLDLAMADFSNVKVLMGNGNGTFQVSTVLNTGNEWGGPVSVAVGDFNADGKLDLGVVSSTYYPGGGWYGGGSAGFYVGKATVLLGSGTGSFTPSSTVDTSVGGFDVTAAVADVNNDGKQDFVVGSESGGVTVHLGSGTGGLGQTIGSGIYSLRYSRMALGDVNGDGKLDAVTTDIMSGSVNILLGNGFGSFVYDPSRVYQTNSAPAPIALADFNGDGKLDVAAKGYLGDVNILLGTGTGTFRPAFVAATTNGILPDQMVKGDFNGDGRQDLVTGGFLLLNDGNWPDPNAPSISVNNVTVLEGNTGTTTATFTVSLSAPASQTVTVRYATQDGTAGPSDYQSMSGVLTFAPGVTTRTVTVPVVGDRVAETDETFQLVLSEPSNAFLSNTRGFGTIVDDEPRPSIDYGPVYTAEGNTGTKTALFTIRLSRAYDVPFGVNYSTFEGDTDPDWYNPSPPAATAGVDFLSASGTLTFAPGETVKTIPVTIIGDLAGEFDECFSVNLMDPPEATQASRHAVGIIQDDDPRVSIDDASVTEGNTGTKNMTFTVTLSRPSTAPISVNYATADGSATVGSDYQAANVSLTFAPGQVSKTITVIVKGDRLGEYDEYFYLNLTSAAGALVEKGQGVGTIVDNEPRISISNPTIVEGNSGTKLMTFTVYLSATYDQAVTVRYATQNGTAKAGEDYVATSGTLTFSPGQISKTFTVAIKGDTKKEDDEDFYVFLSGNSSNSLIEQEYGYGIIKDDDRVRGRR